MPEIEEAVAAQPIRRRLPDERKAIVHHFNVGGYEGYLTIGFYEDGRPWGNFHHHSEGRVNRIRPYGLFCHRSVARPAIRRAAQGALRQVQPHAVRTEWMVRKPGNWIRQVLYGLHIPLFKAQVSPA